MLDVASSTPQIAAAQPSRRSLRSLHWWFVLVVLCGLVGFYKPYFSRFPSFVGTTAAIHFHVATLLSWFALVITQVVLIRRGRTDLHKRLGAVSYVLVPIMFLGFVLALNDGQLRNKNPVLLVATLFDGSLFFSFYVLGIIYRKKPAYHSRFMILAIFPFLNPSLARLISPKFSMPFELAIILTLLVKARVQKKETRPYLVGLAIFIGALAGVITLLVAAPSAPESLWQLVWGP
jgi:hypothetical protein